MAVLSIVVLLTSLVSLFSSASTTSILLPLYVYPGPSASSWTRLFDALRAHPSVNFIIIVDPDSGPGGTAYPNSDYTYGIDKLHGYQNALVIGYVHTRLYPDQPTRVPLETLELNITKYASWAKYSGMNISVQGIFFDEAPNDDSSDSLAFMSSAAAYARGAIPGAYVVYNPGSPTSNKYFSPVPPDLSVQFEGFANPPPLNDYWMGDMTVATFASGEVGRSAVLVHNAPSVSEAQSIVKQTVAEGVGAVYVTPDSFYQDLSYIGDVASALDA